MSVSGIGKLLSARSDEEFREKMEKDIAFAVATETSKILADFRKRVESYAISAFLSGSEARAAELRAFASELRDRSESSENEAAAIKGYPPIHPMQWASADPLIRNESVEVEVER